MDSVKPRIDDSLGILKEIDDKIGMVVEDGASDQIVAELGKKIPVLDANSRMSDRLVKIIVGRITVAKKTLKEESKYHHLKPKDIEDEAKEIIRCVVATIHEKLIINDERMRNEPVEVPIKKDGKVIGEKTLYQDTDEDGFVVIVDPPTL